MQTDSDSSSDVDMQGLSLVTKAITGSNQIVWQRIPSTDNIPPARKIYIVSKTKLPGEKVSALIADIPAPRKVFIVRKNHLPGEELITVAKKVFFDRKTELPQHSSNSTVQGLRNISKKSAPASVQRTLPGQSVSQAEPQDQGIKMVARNAYIKQMTAKMESTEFQERIRGINQLVEDCHRNPDMVMSCICPVFDAIRARLVESNRKVNLHMLEALGLIIPQLKESLSKVLYILIPALVNNHLNSKNTAIYSAALGAIRALVQNIDNALLLEIFVTKAQLLSGQAKADLTDTVADMVMELYSRKPKMVEQEVLPLLWHLLAICKNSRATATLCKALYSQMGPRLRRCAVSQPLSIIKDLNNLLEKV
ncbi:hypothetical protein AAFF_G00138610 [Aldrovandia affinis]|uniref:TOG domain-containing protein n=1 Tax=Aldrovandia affinis TaxID=143900 RepID=A0AAD7X2L5_9TELE|nr:hypothetical protein AAFF_G00138610 [Aldrovandia affinis]